MKVIVEAAITNSSAATTKDARVGTQVATPSKKKKDARVGDQRNLKVPSSIVIGSYSALLSNTQEEKMLGNLEWIEYLNN